jgi:hypothetical protein
MRFYLIFILAFLILASSALALSAPIMSYITINKATYAPGETVIIKLSYPSELGSVQLSITDPNGRTDVSKAPMKNSNGIWLYNYTLKSNSPSGTYSIKINAAKVGAVVNATSPIITFTKSFDIKAWRMDAFLDNYHLNSGDVLNLSVVISDRYSDKIAFKVNYSIFGSDNKVAYNYSFSLPSDSKGFQDYYTIPDNFSMGSSRVYVVIKDSDGRNATDSISFSVTKPFSTSINIIDEKMKSEVIYKNVNIENLMEYNIGIDKVEISDDLENIVSIAQRPYVIEAKGTGIAELKIDTSSLPGGVYSGSVTFISKDVRTVIPVRLEINSGVQSLEGNSYIIWYFAIGIVVAIVIITVVRYRQLKKRRLEELRRAKKAEPKKDIFSETKDEYRTQYY